MEEITITLNEKLCRISQEFENTQLVRILLDDAHQLVEFNNCSIEEQLADIALTRQIHILQNSFEADEDGLVYSKDYLFYTDNDLIETVYFDDNVYHSSLAKAAKISNVDLTHFFRTLEDSYKKIWM